MAPAPPQNTLPSGSASTMHPTSGPAVCRPVPRRPQRSGELRLGPCPGNAESRRFSLSCPIGHRINLQLENGTSNSRSHTTTCGFYRAMFVNRDKCSWCATVIFAVGPFRCLPRIRSASPPRGSSRSIASGRCNRMIMSASCSSDPDSRRSDTCGRLSVRCSGPRLSWLIATTYVEFLGHQLEASGEVRNFLLA